MEWSSCGPRASDDKSPAADARLVQRVADALPVVVQQAPVHLQEGQRHTCTSRSQTRSCYRPMTTHCAGGEESTNCSALATHHQLNGTICEAGPALRTIVEHRELQIPP